MIDIKELKDKIENNNLDTDILIFHYKGNGDFLIHQYLNKYRKDNDLEIEFIDDLNKLNNSNLFNCNNNIIKFCEVETLEDFDTTEKVWIVCKKISKKLLNKYDNCFVDIPALEDWQIKDLIKSTLIKVEDRDIDFMFETYKNNLYRLETELSKINIFEDKSRVAIFNQVKSQLYNDFTEYSIFNIVNSVVNRDKNALLNIYANIDNIDVNPFGLLELLITNFRKVIDVQLAKNPTAESVGVNSKQFWAIQKYSCGHYSKDELVNIYRLLTSIDYRVKSGKLDSSIVTDYVICKILTM